MIDKGVLIVRVGAMGDVLHALPAVAALRAAQPGLRLGWVVDSRWAPLLADNTGKGPLVGAVHLAETRLWKQAPLSSATLRSLRRLRAELRQAGYTDILDLQGTLRSAVLARFAGGRRQVAGFTDPREPLAAMLYGRKLPRQGEHVTQQAANLIGEALRYALPLTPPMPASLLPPRRPAELWAAALLQGIVASRVALLAPTAGWGAKEWPAERFAALAQRLRADGWRVLVNSPAEGHPVVRAVVEGSQGAAAAAVCTPEQLVALVRRMGLVVGNDSGPVHLAALLQRPVVALYGPTDPARNGPWGPGPIAVLRHPSSVTSYRRTAAPEAGLLSLGVDEVLAAARSLLAEPGRDLPLRQ